MSMFSKSQEAGIILTDTEHRIVYFNDIAHNIFQSLQEGALCYKTLYDENVPCGNCPHCTEAGNSVLYSKNAGCWLEISVGKMDISGQKSYNLMLLKPIPNDDKDLLLDLINISDYDELYELNLTADYYKVLHHTSRKFAIPAKRSSLREMLADAAEHMVHPEDREAFLVFWDIDHILERLERKPAMALQWQFRKKLVNGEWCWVLLTAVPVRREEKSDQIVMCFIHDIDGQRHKTGESREADADRLTGLYRQDRFLSAARQFLQQAEGGSYCLMAIDIEHFKLFNEWYGQEAGDAFLSDVGDCLKEAVDRTDGVAGYMGNDDFVILLPDNPDVLANLQNQIMGCVKQYGDQAGFQPAFGLYAIGKPTEPVRTMYDRASMALAAVKGNYAQRSNWYDAGMMAELEGSHKLLSQIQRALEREEFIFYLQPMCNMATGKIVGLESLVRWNHSELGIICPGEFVPLLECNGLISALDQYVWEKVCAFIRHWIDTGHKVIPISVNISRADLFTMDVVECFNNLVMKYELSPKMVQIEITESAYADDFQVITDVVDRLRHAGFTVLMDDFGSGYSSLNMLKNIKLDLLKMDMKFLDMDAQSEEKGSEIVEAITSMAHLMGLRIIAEGVETGEQLKFLLDIGCLYGQGYYFNRPMPVEKFEQLFADDENIDYQGIQPTTTDRLELKELLNGDWLSESVVNNILRGAAVYGVCGNGVELLRANQQYCRVTHTNIGDLETHRESFFKNMYQEDRQKFLDTFQRARNDTINGAEAEIRRILPDGESIWVHLRAFFLREQDGYSLFYSSVSDVSEQMEREQQLESSQRALTAVVHLSEHDEAFMRLTEENQRVAASIFAQMTPGGMIGGYCEAGYPLYFANYEMVKLLGYETYDEFAEQIQYKVENTIHPDDRDRVAQDIGMEYRSGMEYTTTYRILKKDGSWFWSLDKGRVIQAEDGRLAIVSACTDISETMMVQEKLAERNALLLRKNQELTFLNRDMPGGYHRCSGTPGFEFTYISDRFLSIFGYTREEIKHLFDNKFLNMVHPDDRCLVARETAGLREEMVSPNLEYRMLAKHGCIWVVDQSRYMDYANKRFYQGVIIDVTETVALRNKLQMLLRNMPEDIILVTNHNGQYQCESMANGLTRSQGIDLAAYQRSLDAGRYKKSMEQGEFIRIKNELEKAMEARTEYQAVIKLTKPDGAFVWTSLDARYIKDGEEGITYLFLLGDVTAFKEQERELCLTGEQAESILRQAGINSWDWDILSNRLVLRNVIPNATLAEQYSKLSVPYAEVDGFPACIKGLSYIPEDYRTVVEDVLAKVRNGESPGSFKYDIPINAARGETVWMRIACEILRDEKGQPVKAVGYYTDVTAQMVQTLQSREDKKTLELLRRQALYDFIVNLTQDTVGSDESKKRWAKETGGKETYTYTELIHFLAEQLVLPEFKEHFLLFTDRKRMLKQSNSAKISESFEYQRLIDGVPKWMRIEVHYVNFEDWPDVYVYIFAVDIDQQKRQELELTQLAETDAMTGLYNRRAAVNLIRRSLMDIERREAAVIILDLDNFKLANDIFGHAYGDTVLTTVAHKLKSFFCSNDVVCRLGGDEFLVFCRDINTEGVKQKLEKIIKNVILKNNDGQQDISFTLSAGYAMAPEQGKDFEELYREADMALFAAKADGKRKFCKYDSSMNAVHN